MLSIEEVLSFANFRIMYTVHVHVYIYMIVPKLHIRESVDSLCRDETDAPIT